MATVKAVFVDSDGTVTEAVLVNTLGAFQAIVGGYIEAVFGDKATVYVDEEGLLKRLPHNPRATSFANRVLRRGVRLHGRALIVGPPTDDGEDTDVRPDVVDYFKMED